MELVPQLRGDDGRFQIPDPREDLAGLFDAQRALTTVISVAVSQAEAATDPAAVAGELSEPLLFPQHWRSAESGVGTDGTAITYPEGIPGDPQRLASFGGPSFIDGVGAIDGTEQAFYRVADEQGRIAALVSAVPSVLPRVNRILLAQNTSASTWLPPSYALGTAEGEAFLIVDLCVDLATPADGVLRPSAELFIAMQWADSDDLAHLRTSDSGHDHHLP